MVKVLRLIKRLSFKVDYDNSRAPIPSFAVGPIR